MRKPAINKNINSFKTGVLVIALLCGACAHAAAEDTKVKGVEVVPDTAIAVLDKASALLTGNLTCTMAPGKSKYRDDYTVNPLGQRIPRATLQKYDDGVR